MSNLQQSKIQLLIIVLLTTLAFINIFSNQLVIDDTVFILNWEAGRSLSNIGEFFKGAVPPGHEGVYRPIRSLLFALYYQLWGSQVFGYHLHSLTVHLLSTVFIYLIIQKISSKRSVGFIAGLLFGLHPIHTESITYIAASMEMTGVVFFLASFYFYLRGSGSCRSRAPQFTHCANKRGAPLWGSPARATPHFYYILSIILAVLAFFTYEMTLTLPLLIVLYDLCFKNLTRKNLKEKIKIYTPFFGLALFYLIIRFFLLNITSRGPYLADSFYLTMLTMTKVFIKYLSLVLAPVNQASNHVISQGIEAFVYRDYRTEAIASQTIFSPEILIPTLILLCLVVSALIFWKRWPLITFGIFWFFIALLPVSEIVPQGSMLNEKMLYLPSFGLILIMAYLLDKLVQIKKVIGLGTVISLILIYGYLTYQRNLDWKDAVTLWSKDIAAYPQDNAYAYFALGNAFAERGENEKAVTSYQKSFEINPRFVVALGSIGRVYQNSGQPDQAISIYHQALKINPKFWEAAVLLGNIYDRGTWVEYKIKNQLAFFYPQSWQVEEDLAVMLKESSGFEIEISLEKRKASESVNEYLSRQPSLPGKLVNQGMAQIPGVDLAYVRIWDDQGIQKHQFFLFKSDRAFKILVYPSDSPLMKQFDKIIGSIKFV